MNRKICPNCQEEFDLDDAEDAEEEYHSSCSPNNDKVPSCLGCCAIMLWIVAWLAVLTMFLLWFHIGGNPNGFTFWQSTSLGIGVAGLCGVGIYLIVRSKFPLTW